MYTADQIKSGKYSSEMFLSTTLWGHIVEYFAQQVHQHLQLCNCGKYLATEMQLLAYKKSGGCPGPGF